MPAVYRQADVVVVTSRFESQSVAAVEAAACGCAIVGTPVGLLAEIDGAQISVSHDSAAIAAALLRVASDDTLLRRRGKRARNWAQREATVGNTVDTLVKLYEEIAHQ